MSTHAATPTKFSSDRPIVAHHFDDWQQQYDSCLLGMWVFLVSEVMFFGGLFATYMVYRYQTPEAFARASHELDVYLGTVNTCALLTSSLTMVLAVRAGHLGKSRHVGLMLALTMLLGFLFLVIKFYEYFHKYQDGLAPILNLPFRHQGADAGPVRIFLGLYFAMTGVHALHMIIGVAMLAIFFVHACRGRYQDGKALSLEIVGLYWHFVDVIWIFLFPMLYLIDRSK